MKDIKLRSLENSSILVKFQIFFIVLAIIPLCILMYLLFQIKDDGAITMSADQLSNIILLALVGIISGYVAMRIMLKNLIDVTEMSTVKIREMLGPEKIQDFLKGSENEITVLTRTFQEVTDRLEENVTSLELTKKTLQSVLTRVGQGIASLRDINTFLDLIVETMTEALAGKKGMLLLWDEETNKLNLKTIYGFSTKSLDKRILNVETSPFTPVLHTKTAIIIPQIQYLKQQNDTQDALDYPIVCAPLILRDKVMGVIAVSGRKIGTQFQEEEMVLLFNLATQTAVAIENSKLSLNADNTYFETLAALAMAVEAKDPYSRGHLDRVGSYSVMIAQYIGLEPHIVADLRDAAKIHDVGKIGVTDELLGKTTPLTEEDWTLLKRHPEIGEGIIRPISSLTALCDIVRHHHEKLDGSGYPDGLKDEQISMPVRILAVADIYDALTSDRPYRKALAPEDALRMMREMAGKIDQSLVAVLTEILADPNTQIPK